MPKKSIPLYLTLFSMLLASTRSVYSFSPSSGVTGANNWTQVNDSAFGLGVGDYERFSGEEAKELLVYDNQLYLGMEADNSFGARLWRSRDGVSTPASQSDWEEVSADNGGLPFGGSVTQNDHIDSLAEFNNYLYVSTGNRGDGGNDTEGTLLYRSATGDSASWVQVNNAGFGDTHNENFKDMIVFQGWLCGGTWNQTDGAEVWCSQDGTNWMQKNTSGFGSTVNIPANFIALHSFVFQNKLYFGVENYGADEQHNQNDVAKIFRTSDINGSSPVWEEVYSGMAGSLNADLLGELNGYLYIATSSPEGIIILRSLNGDDDPWTQVNLSGMNGNPNNTHTYNDSSVVIDDHLYVAVNNSVNGFGVWRTTGNLLDGNNLIDWEQFGPGGWSDSHNIYAGLVVFNDLLYAWTTNYQNGQQVRRADSLVLFHIYLPQVSQNAD
ncbi:MAG: hypothetical protein JW908_12295 [Anaerolineales bacterium]|nr:hypothetical protein [Anaerolineales bacterium]